jgi:16S rRNA processing protein RimM
LKTKHSKAFRAVAKIIGLFGIRGELKIFSYARTVDEFENLGSVFCGTAENATEPCVIESVRVRGKDIYLKFAGVDDRTAAESYRGKFLFVEEMHRKKLPKEKFFVDDLVGCAVVGNEGKKYGTIRSVDALPAQMIYTVRTANGDVMLPAVPEFIRSVDVEKREIVIDPPEGLFEGEML